MGYNPAWQELAVQLVPPLDLGDQKEEHLGQKEGWAINLKVCHLHHASGLTVP